MRILHVTAPGSYGGLESVVRSLARGQQVAGCHVDVVAIREPSGQPHPFVAALASDGIRAHEIEVSRRAYARERAALRAICVQLQPSIIHTHGYHTDVVDAPVAKLLDTPVVTTVHGFTGYGWRGRFYEAVQRRAFRRFDAVIAVSQPIAMRLRSAGIDPNRIHTIPNALDDRVVSVPRHEARQLLNLPQDAFVVGWVGRLTPEKGPDIFIEALAQLADTNVLACIIGDGPERAALAAQSSALGVADSITWAGTIPDAASLFSAFDALVLSSRTEGTPIVVIEAVNARIPVVATRVGGVPDLVTGAEAALVEPLSATGISSAIRLVKNMPEEAERRVVAATERLRTHNAHPAWVTQYDCVYRTLLNV